MCPKSIVRQEVRSPVPFVVNQSTSTSTNTPMRMAGSCTKDATYNGCPRETIRPIRTTQNENVRIEVYDLHNVRLRTDG